MSSGVTTVIYPVKDLERAKQVFGRLAGVSPAVDGEYYVQFEVGGQKIGLDPNGHAKGMIGPVGYWQVDDIRASLQLLVDAGAQTQQEVTDVGNGKLIASVRDVDGNVLGLVQEP